MTTIMCVLSVLACLYFMGSNFMVMMFYRDEMSNAESMVSLFEACAAGLTMITLLHLM